MTQQHAEYSPSKLEYLEKCPCYQSKAFDSEGNPIDEKDSEAAARGNRLHDALDKDNTDNIFDDEEMAICEATAMLRDQLVEEGEYTGTALREEKIHLSLNDYETHGYADFVAFNKDETKALMIDYKFGRTPVTAAYSNLQQHCYAVGLFQRFPELQSIEITLLCPHLDPKISSATVLRETLLDQTAKRIEAVLEKCEDPNKQPEPSPSACQFCKAKATCPALGGIMNEIAKRYTGLPLPEEFAPDKILSVRDRTLAQLIAPLAEDWGKQVKKLNAQAVQEQGLELPGFNFVERSGGFAIKDAFQMIEMAADTYKVPKETLQEILKASMTDLIAKIRECGAQNSAKEIRDELIQMGSMMGVLEEKSKVSFLQKQRNITPDEILLELK